MTVEIDFKNDPRTIEELVNIGLSEIDEEHLWNAVCSLHWKGTAEVLQRAERLCASKCSHERRLGAQILGQLGLPERSFPVECTKILRGMLLDDEEAEVLEAVLVGLSFQNSAEAVSQVINFSSHAHSGVRHAVVLALADHAVPLAIRCLITLSRDLDDHVRDWATFTLGTLIELDTPQIRDALAERVDDLDADTRAEAIVGLARRKDVRVIAALKRELSSGDVGTLAVEAAELIASPELHSNLVDMREWWDIDPALLERAISASVL